MTTQEGLQWMGVMIMAVTCTLSVLHWPAWGGMFTPAKAGATEEDYYLSEWDAEEVAVNLHIPSLRFAMESRSMRGKKLLESYLVKEEGLECYSQDVKKAVATVREDLN